MAERLWMATDEDGRTYMYCEQPKRVGCEFATSTDDCDFSVVGFDDDDNTPPPGECWEYVRTDLVTASQECLAKAAETENALRAEIDRLKAELASAKKMPECVEKLVARHEGECGFWDVEVSAVRRHYATPVTLSVGEWRLSDGSKCRVFSDGKKFVVLGGGSFWNVKPDGGLTKELFLVERIGD